METDVLKRSEIYAYFGFVEIKQDGRKHIKKETKNEELFQKFFGGVNNRSDLEVAERRPVDQ